MRKGDERQVIFSTQIYKLFNIPGRPIISNCGAPTEKASEFLDYHLKTGHTKQLVIYQGFMGLSEKDQIGNLPENSILVTANVVGLYPSIPHEIDLKALEEALEKESLRRSLLTILV